jgi:hypothetical protein
VLIILLVSRAFAAQGWPADWLTYEDPSGRFRFSYPSSFGIPSQGTNDGFGDRVAAIRFSEFSSGLRGRSLVLGGEATLTRGWIYVDLQAVGGLYDSIALEALTDPLRAKVVAALPSLSPRNFCAQLGRPQHLDPASPVFSGLSAGQKTALAGLDQLRNINPTVHRCELSGDVVVFHKECAFSEAQPLDRQHVYGAVRFLSGTFSSFQIVRATSSPPAAEILTAIGDVVKSIRY